MMPCQRRLSRVSVTTLLASFRSRTVETTIITFGVNSATRERMGSNIFQILEVKKGQLFY